MQRVFVIQETLKHNLLPAQAFGELVFSIAPNGTDCVLTRTNRCEDRARA
jgi:hypothetical protein